VHLGSDVTIYLDNMAATPIDSRVAAHHYDLMLTLPANPDSTEHSAGQEAQQALQSAAETICGLITRDPTEVIFVPGASAALWVAVEDALTRAGGRPARILASASEHPSLLSILRNAERVGRARLCIIPVDPCGAPDPEALANALTEGADLVCTMAANNEVGTVTDLEPLIDIARPAGAKLLVDASQAAGRVDLNTASRADYIVLSGAKLYGPRRSGALVGTLRPNVAEQARALFGSSDAASASALAFALRLRLEEMDTDEPRIAALRDRLQAILISGVPGLQVNGDLWRRLAGALHVSTPHVSGDIAVARLWGRVAVSTGAACQSGVPGPSHVLAAMRLPEWAQDGAVRIGIGRFNTPEEIEVAGMLMVEAFTRDEPERRRA
jgi:cysteine desulfurase